MANISAPDAIPHQNPRNPFPAWRLRNGVMNATDGELENSSESCELWGWWCGGIVVVAVAAEVLIAAVNLPYGSFFEHWGNVFAGAIIALGVAGEVMFARMGHGRDGELKRRAGLEIARLGDEAAQANNHAQQAQLELAKFKAPRSLTPTQAGILASIVRPFSKTPFSFLVAPGAEPLAFLQQIGVVLTQEGWERVKCETASGIEITFGDKPSAGIVLAIEGIVVEIAELKRDEWQKPMEALVHAFGAIGHKARGHTVSPGTAITGSVRINVGVKP
jgi:hypothetical protein